MQTPSLRSTTTRRQFVYSYHYSAAASGKPTVLFLHGFPSTHRDWAVQIEAFSKQGYGVIAPDLLGYGKTSAPTDVHQYKMLDMAGDVIDILNDLKLEKVIGVGHDWGCFLLSRLLDKHIHKFLGAAFLAVGYMPPQPDFNYKEVLKTMKHHIGYEVFGYWEFFAAEDAAAICTKNIDSFYRLIFPNDPDIWVADLAPLGAARTFITSNKQPPKADFWTVEEENAHKAALLEKGFHGPLNWYGARILGINNEDEGSIPLDTKISIPVLFIGSGKDKVCLANLMEMSMKRTCSNLTVKVYDVSHWIMLEASESLNKDLGDFLYSL